jgi:hypothetical protein
MSQSIDVEFGKRNNMMYESNCEGRCYQEYVGEDIKPEKRWT